MEQEMEATAEAIGQRSFPNRSRIGKSLWKGTQAM